MTFWLPRQIITLFLDIFSIIGVADNDKDLEIIILRQQVRILQRKGKSAPRISPLEKIVLGEIVSKLA
jgi:hypothetical protein